MLNSVMLNISGQKYNKEAKNKAPNNILPYNATPPLK